MRLVSYLALGLISFNANANTVLFDTNPFAGTDALTTPGRQVVGGESFLVFDVATDVFAFDTGIFGIGSILFVNDLVVNVPAAGVNTIVLRTFDNDSNPATAFGAGNAASLIADQITSPGPGFFIYFNQGLDLPRLVYSTDLSDHTSDLKILARMTNLSGPAGSAQLPNFTAVNFAAVPEPSSLLITAAGALLTCGWGLRRRRIHG